MKFPVYVRHVLRRNEIHRFDDKNNSVVIREDHGFQLGRRCEFQYYHVFSDSWEIMDNVDCLGIIHKSEGSDK